MDGSEVHEFPVNMSWLILEQTPSKKLSLSIPPIQLELTAYQPNFAFALTVPSHIFGGIMEGLCGNCNEDSEDDLKKQDGEVRPSLCIFQREAQLFISRIGLFLRSQTTRKTLLPAGWSPSRRTAPVSTQPRAFLLKRRNASCRQPIKIRAGSY